MLSALWPCRLGGAMRRTRFRPVDLVAVGSADAPLLPLPRRGRRGPFADPARLRLLAAGHGARGRRAGAAVLCAGAGAASRCPGVRRSSRGSADADQLLDVAQIGQFLAAARPARSRRPRRRRARCGRCGGHRLSGTFGSSKLTTWLMPSTSMPRAAMSVATRTRILPVLNAASARSRWFWLLLPWIASAVMPAPVEMLRRPCRRRAWCG